MANRRLNKKVALVGSAIVTILILGAILIFLHLGHDPEKFIKDGDAALKAAREATDEQIKKQEYERAIRGYANAEAKAKSDSVKVEMLFKLADIYIETGDWTNVHAHWNRIIQINPRNIRARLCRLKFFYVMADSVGVRLWQWQEVESQASELIEIAEDMDLLMEDTARWDTSGIDEDEDGIGKLGPYLYLCRGRALLEIADLGGVTDPEELLMRSVSDLEKAMELAPANVEIYSRLARAYITKGTIFASRGDIESRDESRKKAIDYLTQAVDASNNDVRARIDLLAMESALSQGADDEQILSYESEYLSLVEEFNSNPQIFSALSRFYTKLGYKYLDKAITAAEKTLELDNQNVSYAINITDLCYQKYSIYGDKQAIYKAIETAQNALTLPDAIDKSGPRQGASRMNRIALYLLLANCYVEQVLEPCEVRTDKETDQWLANAEQVMHEIEQLFGSGEDPYVIGWQGMLELAKGNKNSAVRKLYAAYEQIKVSGIEEPESPSSLFRRSYAQFSYVLSKVFGDTSELGAVEGFLESSLKTGIGNLKPEAILDYSDVLVKLMKYSDALSGVRIFEEEYWTNERSQILRTNIYIAAKQFNDAEEEIAKRPPDDPNTVKLQFALVQAKIEQLEKVIDARKIQEGLGPVLGQYYRIKEEIEKQTAELKSHSLTRAELVEKLLLLKPDFVGEDTIITVCDDYIADEKTKQALSLVNRFLQHFPDNTKVLVYKQILAEPNPGEISQRRREQIEEQVLLSISDPTERAKKLGIFYREHDNLDKASGEFKKLLRMETIQEGIAADLITDTQRFAADHLLDVAVEQEDWVLAEQIIKAGRYGNLDDCGGQFFTARFHIAKGEYEKALAELDASLKQKPVFSRAFLLKSKVNTVLRNENEAIENARKASSLNPFDGDIAQELAFVLYSRNRKLGENATSDQILEGEDALRRAVVLNIDNPELLSFYSEYLASTDPLTALAIRKKLQTTEPSIQNAVLLGRMAARIAHGDDNQARKEILFEMADSAFEQAREMDPTDKLMLMYYSEYLQGVGRTEEADGLLRKSEDQRLLWAHYIQTGQLEEAKKILEQLHRADPEEPTAIQGLLVIAEKEVDEESIKKYSEVLLSLDDSAENNLLQIQIFLNVGLIKEAEYKLQSFKEKFPDDGRILMLEALLEMKQGRLYEALQLANKGLETSQENAIAWRLRGQINLLMANYDQAIIDLKTSKALLDEPVTRMALARAYQRASRYEDAITELRALIINPQAPEQAVNLLEWMYWRLDKKEELRRFYEETLEKFPDSVHWLNRAGEFAINTGNLEKAEQLYKQAWQKSLEDGKGDATAIEGYLGTLVAAGKLTKLFEEAGKYTDGDFAPVVFVKMAEAKLKSDEKQAAVEYLRRALDKAGQSVNAASSILRVMYILLGAEEVEAYCRELLEANPDSLVPNIAMFNLKAIGGKYDEAVVYVDKCLQIVGPDSLQRDVYIGKKVEILTIAYAKTSDNKYLKKAIIEYESLLDKMPNNPGVLNNLAYMLAEENVRLGEALEYAKKAHDTMPNNPSFLDTYSYVLYKNGKYSEAAENLQAALQLYEQMNISASSDVYEHLGMIKEKLGSIDEAIAAYELALEIGKGGLTDEVKERLELAIKRLRSQN